MSIKSFRKKEGISQKELINILKQNGYTCTPPALSKVENGSIAVSEEMLQALRKAFPNVNPSWFTNDDQVLARYREIHHMTKKEMVDEIKYFYKPFDMELLESFENGENVFSYTIIWAIQQAFGIDLTDKSDHESLLEYAAACQVAKQLHLIQIRGMRGLRACRRLNINIDEFLEDVQKTAKQLISDTPGGNAFSIQSAMRHGFDLLQIEKQVNECAETMHTYLRRPTDDIVKMINPYKVFGMMVNKTGLKETEAGNIAVLPVDLDTESGTEYDIFDRFDPVVDILLKEAPEDGYICLVGGDEFHRKDKEVTIPNGKIINAYMIKNIGSSD